MVTTDAWIKQADNDYKMAQISFKENMFEWAIYCASQSVEKVLKAIILILYPKIPKKELWGHDIQRLVDKLPIVFKEEQIEIDCKIIDDAFQYSRYPTQIYNGQSPCEMCTKEISDNAIKVAERLLKYYNNVYNILKGITVSGY